VNINLRQVYPISQLMTIELDVHDYQKKTFDLFASSFDLFGSASFHRIIAPEGMLEASKMTQKSPGTNQQQIQ